MKLLYTFIFLVHALVAQDYFTIDEFQQLDPTQKKKMQGLDSLVQKKPIPISIKQKNAVKITIIYPGGEISDYWRRSKIAFEKRLQALNIKYQITDFFIDANNIVDQSKKIRESLKNSSDYLVFTLDINSHKKIITQLLSRKKPKIILQNVTTPLKEWQGNQPFLYVGFDHIEGTKLLANYYQSIFTKNIFTNGANYVMLYFKKGYISQMRGDSFITMMNRANKYNLIDSFYTDGKATKAYEAAKLALEKHKNLDFIYASSTDVSIGAKNAAIELGIPIVINGWGGGSTELSMIKDKELSVTVMRMNDDNGIAMAEAIKLDLEHKTDTIPTVYSGKFVLIDTSTSIKKIEEFQKQAFRYSNNK